MTRRPGKASQTYSPRTESIPLSHLKRHVHLTNCVHIKNHLHMQKHELMLDTRRNPQLPLRRELTAVRKVKSLRDPSTSSSFSSLSVDSFVTRVDSRETGGVQSEVPEAHEPRRNSRRNKVRNGEQTNGHPRGANRVNGSGMESLPKREKYQSGAIDFDRDAQRGEPKRKEHRESNNSRGEKSATYRWDGELEIGAGARVLELRGRGRRRDCEYNALPQWGNYSPSERGTYSCQQREEHLRDERQVGGYTGEERWAGDAEELARRLISEQYSHMSPHSYMSNLTRAHALSLLGLGDQISEAGGSFLESDQEGDLIREHAGVSSSHMSNSESPLMGHGQANGRGYRKPRSSGRRQEMKRVREGMNLRVGLHSRGRGRTRRSVGYKEVPVVPIMTDELEASEIPHNGCGMPWYWSSLHKYKGKGLLDFSGIGFACGYPESIKKKGDSKDVSRNGSRTHSRRDLPEPVPTPAQSTLSSLDSDVNALPLVTGEEESYDEIVIPALSLDDRDPPARAGRVEVATKERPRKREGGRKKSLLKDSDEKAPKEINAVVAAAESGTHRSTSQKYRPKSFKDVVGQPLVVKSLSNAITKGRVAPVYLFTGHRGTGKTSTARIFAAALICLNTEPHRRPCGLCRECATLTLNRSKDVKEIDVASNPELDNMRALLGNMNLSPSHARYRVFIVEDCDYLSTEMWNTFLKFLEEPPRNVVFILITTDLDRLPPTAISRCQKFPFGKVKESEIVIRLQMLTEKENLEVEDAALLLIASRADGSVRDAETTLDQLSLLDKSITLSIVQELGGLIPDSKLIDLLDLALGADTVNTVKCMRELLDSGVDALSLVAQLGSLITNILAGTFDIHRESRKKGFFRRNLPRREEQQRLRQALKVLSESEKQLRVSNDRPTWLTAALLQFAPDRSYLPSSVDTSMAPSPIAFDTFEKIMTGEPDTPRLPPSGDTTADQHKLAQSAPKDVAPKFPRVAYSEKDKEKVQTSLNAYLEGRKRALPCGNLQDEGNYVHPTKSPLAMGQAARTTNSYSLVLFDPSRFVGTRDFRVLARRDLEDVWEKVLDGCRSNVLRELLHCNGTLMSLFVAQDDTYAVAHVEFRNQEHRERAERLRSSTCHAFQMALGCPVELKISLELPPDVVLEEIKASQDRETTTEVKPGPTTSSVSREEPQGAMDMENFSTRTVSLPGSSVHEQRQRKHSKNRKEQPDGLVDPAFGKRADPRDARPGLRATRMVGHHWFPNECIPRDVADIPVRQRSGRRTSLKMMMQQPSGRRESLQDLAKGEKRQKQKRRKNQKFKGIISIEQDNLRLESGHKPTRGLLCWKSLQPEQGRQAMQQQRRVQTRAAFFLRLVPCARSRSLSKQSSRAERSQTALEQTVFASTSASRPVQQVPT